MSASIERALGRNRSRPRAATNHDLEHMEQRLLAAIRGDAESGELLSRILHRAARLTRRLEAADRAYPPKEK